MKSMSITQLLLNQIKPLSKGTKLCTYFNGAVEQIWTIKTVLEKTTFPLTVYFFKDCVSMANKTAENSSNPARDHMLLTLENLKKTHLDFEYVEISLLNQKDHLNPIDDVSHHLAYIDQIYLQVSGFDTYLLTCSPHTYKDTYRMALIQSHMSNFKKELPILPLFCQLDHTLFYASILPLLARQWVNLDGIYNRHKTFIDAIELKDSLIEFEPPNCSYELLFLYVIRERYLSSCIDFISQFGHYITPTFYQYILTHYIGFSGSSGIARAELIRLCVEKGAVSTESLNIIIRDKVKQFADTDNASDVAEVDYFFRLFGHQITEETKDNLMFQAFNYYEGFNRLLLEKIMDLGGDVGELLLVVIDAWKDDIKEKSAILLLEDYAHKIHPLQLNEALLMAFEKKLYVLCYKLIETGADQTLLSFHNDSYGDSLWRKESQVTFRGDAYRITKDQVIIDEILNELGNPQKKVPPVIHVTGSNGKGSVCAFLRSILENNGYKTHVFTSPECIRFNDNVVLAGEEIRDAFLYDCLIESETAYHKIKDRPEFQEKIRTANEEDQLTDDEIENDNIRDWSIIIPAVMLAYSKVKADVMIVEVIQGGEFDETNIFDEKTTIATVINTIIFGDNHIGMKGFETIENVARTKSRLSKPGIPIFSVQQEVSVMKVIEDVAKERGCPLLVEGKDWTMRDVDDSKFEFKSKRNVNVFKTHTVNYHQAKNFSLALATLLNQKQFKILLSTKKVRSYTTAFFCAQERYLSYKGSDICVSWGKQSKSIETNKKKIDKIYPKRTKSLIFTNNPDESTLSCTNSYKSCKYDEYLYIKTKTKDDYLSCIIQLGIQPPIKSFISSGVIYLLSKRPKDLIHLNITHYYFVKSLQLFKLNSKFTEIKQSNFECDIKFAKKHKLLDQEALELMEGKKIFLLL